MLKTIFNCQSERNTTVTVYYGGPQLSRQNQKPHGLNKIPHGKTENLTAKTKTSRQNQNPHGKTKALKAKHRRTGYFLPGGVGTVNHCPKNFCKLPKFLQNSRTETRADATR